jgi:Cu(I)/Ag(I) efflux system membrane protein CusA/SilA
MLSTGIKTPVGVKISGPDLNQIDKVAAQVEAAVKNLPGVTSALAERLTGGRYIDVDINRLAAARYGLSVGDAQAVVSSAVGGENVGEVIAGRERFPINIRYPREVRDSLEKLRQLPVVTDRGAQIQLGDVADLHIADGPPMIRSENARLSGFVYIDIRNVDLQSAVKAMQQAVAQKVTMPPGYSIAWSGQFEYLERAAAKLRTVVPVTLVVDLRAAVPDVQLSCGRASADVDGAIRAGRRILADLDSGACRLRCHISRLHRTRRRGGRVRRGHAAVPEGRTEPPHRGRRALDRGNTR